MPRHREFVPKGCCVPRDGPRQRRQKYESVKLDGAWSGMDKLTVENRGRLSFFDKFHPVRSFGGCACLRNSLRPSWQTFH